jgi:hypothetical protein
MDGMGGWVVGSPRRWCPRAPGTYADIFDIRRPAPLRFFAMLSNISRNHLLNMREGTPEHAEICRNNLTMRM